MRSHAFAFALSLLLGGCHGNKPAQNAENTGETGSSEESAGKSSADSHASGEPSALDNANVDKPSTKGDRATVRDDTEKNEAACSGNTIADLIASLSQASCELPANAAPAQPQPNKDVLDVRVSSDARVVPGATAQVRITFRNKGKTNLPLDFTVDPDARFGFELYTPKGARVDKPAGPEPALPSEVSDSDAVEAHLARIVLLPNGTATATLPWQAVKYKWASKEKARGALPGRGYPREPAGPLAKGNYVLRVITPLANVDDGLDHEMSQPRVNVEIAGIADKPTPPPPPTKAAPAGSPPASGSAPASGSTRSASDAEVEAKFLKVTGQTPPAASASPPKKKKH